ncbi:14896_t:CDS:2, partial [Acaulospora colombiana]
MKLDFIFRPHLKRKMSAELLILLSTDFTQLLESAEDFNVLIRVGEQPKNYKEFKAHSVVLRARSSYFKSSLADQWVEREGNFYVLKKPNVLPEIFDIILNGTVSLEDIGWSRMIELLVAADELCLRQLLNYVQSHFVTNGIDWLRDNFYKKLLLEMLKCDDLQLEEVDVWNVVLKWGSSQANLSLQNEALPKDVYEEILRCQLTKDTFLISSLMPPRGIALDSNLIGSRHAALIANWIDRREKFSGACQIVPYHFNLLLRGTRDSFKEDVFHELCDNQGPTLVVAKVRDTGELIGGFNPVGWSSSGLWIETTESFIFSLGDGLDPELGQAVLSRILNTKCAIDDSPSIGPCFGVSDLVM